LSGLQAFWGARYYYERTLDPDQPIAVPGLPTDFALLQVDRVLLSRADLQGMGMLFEEMGSERVSTDDFMAHSFGYALIAGANIAGWCLSEYNLAQRCEVGIATLEPHQRRGLATANGLAFLDLARAQGITRVGWHCWANNRASSATAEKLGYSRVREYGSFGCPANPAQA
jgi:GNAT superfamily N-acetyltransferase